MQSRVPLSCHDLGDFVERAGQDEAGMGCGVGAAGGHIGRLSQHSVKLPTICPVATSMMSMFREM